MPTPINVFVTAADLDTAIGSDEHSRLAAAGITPERFAAVVADVNDEIAGAVGAKVLAAVPKAFVHHGCAIARYRLHKDKATERMKDDQDAATKYFSEVQRGNVYLQLAADPASDQTTGAGVWFTASPPRFTGTAY